MSSDREPAEKSVKDSTGKTAHGCVNRTTRAAMGAIFVFVIMFSAISICQNIGKTLRADITEQKIYSLSDGTKAILAKLNQPITLKLYYAKTAAMKGPDQIRYFNNYYEFVKSLLEQYATQAKGMVDLKIIDPRPYSEQEVEALQYGLQRFSISEEENFFFGLVAQTQFGVEKVIPFFSPDRQNFIEYDISYLIDTAITRQKKRLGIMSSLPVMGDDASSYMAQMMRMQGKQPTPPWTFVEQLRKKYEVTEVPTDVNDVNDVDILLVIHPKDLPERTLFAIDQFVLKSGRTVVCVDPFCITDRPDRSNTQMMMSHSQSSNMDKLLRTWGLTMPENTFVGDRGLAQRATITRDQRPETIIGFLNLGQDCFNADSVITTDLNQVRILFAGVLREIADINDPNIEWTPLITTTDKGNSFTVDSSAELMFLQPAKLMSKFYEGTKPVTMAYLVTGRLASSFPDGIEVEVESSSEEDPNEIKKTKKRITGLKQAEQDCAVAVFSDVDFISDMLAYQESFFGKLIVGDNSALLMNTIDDLTGSSDLISIRSRGNFQRPFTVVKEIETQAEKETAEEVAKLNTEIQGFNNELQQILASAKKERAEIVGSSILQKQRQLELKKRQAQRQLREVRKKRHYRIEQLGNKLRNFNMLTAPAVILAIAVVLAMRRSVRKRHYISHSSDA